jgi:hypothetical protein
MSFLIPTNDTVREILAVAERLDKNSQQTLLKNIRLFELKTKAQQINASIKKGEKPSITEISALVRKVRKQNAVKA